VDFWNAVIITKKQGKGLAECALCNNGFPVDDSKDSIPIHRLCWYSLVSKVGFTEAYSKLKEKKR